MAKVSVRHGHARSRTANGITREWRCWWAMKTRCTRPSRPNYERYGGRGVAVCERWAESFEAFLSDMGPCPSPEHSLDRFPDNDGNYEPGNCRWATRLEQGRNKSNCRMLTHNGKTQNMSAWAEEVGLPYHVIQCRLRRGKSVSEALAPITRKRPASRRASR